MDLDNLQLIKQIDTQNMLGHIDDLPDQLVKAWELGKNLPLPDYKDFKQIVIAGMGGSAIGGDLLAAYATKFSTTPVTILRDYTLPPWENVLVICSSHSGNTEETLSVFEQSVEHGHPILAISTGGKLAEKATQQGVALWTFEDDFQPRAAVGFSFGLLLAAATRLGMFEEAKVSAELSAAVQSMKDQQVDLQPEVPVSVNMAKRLAGQFFQRWVVIYGSGFLAPVARRWKTQINEIPKAQATFEILPEANHNTLQGIHNPENLMAKSVSFFLRSKHLHPRNQLREKHTRKIMMLEGLYTDFYKANGTSLLEDMWTTLHFGDYLSFYLSVAYQVDPTPVPMLANLKQTLNDHDDKMP
jgi:glucose/mannose-6-phosphate isomerase